MKTIMAFIKRYPLLSYFALTFAISWCGMLLARVVGGPGGSYGGVPMLAWFAGPPVAGILMTGLLYGRAGLRDLLSSMTRWRVSARWYALALLVAPLFYVAVLLALSLTSPEFLPVIFVSDEKATLVLFGIAYGLIGGGLLEELGWTGFAVPTLLRQRYGVLSTGLIVGLMWGALHFLPIFWAISPSGALALGLILPLQLFAWLPAYRVLMVWVYERTGESLLVAMLMHASLSASMLILVPMTLAGVPSLTFILVWAAVLWVAVAAVALAQGGHLTRQPPLRRRVA